MGSARWLALGSLVAMAGLLEGRVVREEEAGFGECDKFFYAETPPALPAAEAHVKLCQRSAGAAHFATLYSTQHRTPVYSAFRAARPGAGGEPERGLVEPQIDDPSSSLEEMMDEADATTVVSNLGSKQALNTDYLESDYQKGQLYPFPLSHDDHMATFTLTNAVPMTSSFRERWYMNLNSLMDRALAPQCGNGEDLYLIAGAVPSDHRVKGKVAVPEFVWLAACCASPGGWAMGFVKHAGGGDVIEDVMVKDLEKLLPSHPQLFQNNCGDAEQDTEKMKRILEMVNRVQDEERVLLSQESAVPLSSTKSKRSADLLPPEAPEESSSLLRKLISIIATPYIKLFQWICYLVVGVLKYLLFFLWFVTKLVINGIEGCLYRLGSAAISYFLAIGEELVSIPWKVLKVFVRIIRAVLRILCCLLKAVCRVLGIPVRVLVDVAMFPVYTMSAIPIVCRDIAVGVGGTVSLLLDTAFGTMGGLFQVALGICKQIGYRVTLENSGEL
ncbi:endonuclease domain-containing 1 protein [Echinops telfairi]|uniref:Endonuclease domain-containing 1 protein n=1 Tax=Echinops telfairi TaxID=9371 RepID=A0ABM0IW35_ECHTE|nr:endonuclease domain-containing 1 protein [Echinops telfairi]